MDGRMVVIKLAENVGRKSRVSFYWARGDDEIKNLPYHEVTLDRPANVQFVLGQRLLCKVAKDEHGFTYLQYERTLGLYDDEDKILAEINS